VAHRDHLDLACRGAVQGGDDLAQALQVGRVVGDHQRVVAGISGDGVVGRDQRAQHRHQVGRGFVAQAEDLGDDLVAARQLGAPNTHGAVLQFGIGLGHDP
jgi:hypothetical protein